MIKFFLITGLLLVLQAPVFASPTIDDFRTSLESTRRNLVIGLLRTEKTIDQMDTSTKDTLNKMTPPPDPENYVKSMRQALNTLNDLIVKLGGSASCFIKPEELAKDDKKEDRSP